MLTPNTSQKQLKKGLPWAHSQEVLAVGPEGEVAGHVTAVVQLASSFFCSLWNPSSWNKWCRLHSRCISSHHFLSGNALADMSRAVSPWCSSSVRLTVRISNHSHFLRVTCNPLPLQSERKRCLNNGIFLMCSSWIKLFLFLVLLVFLSCFLRCWE